MIYKEIKVINFIFDTKVQLTSREIKLLLKEYTIDMDNIDKLTLQDFGKFLQKRYLENRCDFDIQDLEEIQKYGHYKYRGSDKWSKQLYKKWFLFETEVRGDHFDPRFNK
jgi:hypothetical protein